MPRSFSLSFTLLLALLGAWSTDVASAAPGALPWGPSTPLVRGTSLVPREFADVLYRGDDGSMLVTVRTPRGVVTAVRSPRGRFGVPRLIPTGRTMAVDKLWPRPIVAAGGRSLLLWQPEASGSSVAGAVIDPVRGPRRLRLPPMQLDQLTSVALDRSGEVTIVAGLFGDPLQVVTGRADNSPLRVQSVAAAEEGASLGSVASSRGGAAVAWRARVPCPDPAANGCMEVRAAVRPPGAAAFGPASTLDAVSWAGVDASLSAPQVNAVDDRLIVTWRNDDPRTGVHAVRVAVVAGTGFLPTRSVPGTEPNTIVESAETSACVPSGSGPLIMTAGENPVGVGLLPRPGGGSLLFLRRQDTLCGAALEMSSLTDAGEPSAPRQLSGLRSRPNESPRLQPGPNGHALIVSREGQHLAFARLDGDDAAALRPVSVQDAEYVASGWDGRAAIVVAQVRCGPRMRRTDAWVLTDSGTRRAHVWPCQPGQPPMELDEAGHLVLVGLAGRNRFVARASCRLATWVTRPRAACHAPRA